MAVYKNASGTSGSHGRTRQSAKKSAPSTGESKSSGQTAKKTLKMPSRNQNANKVSKTVVSKRALQESDRENSAPKRRRNVYELPDEEIVVKTAVKASQVSKNTRPRKGARKSAASELLPAPEVKGRNPGSESSTHAESLASHEDRDGITQDAIEGLINLKLGIPPHTDPSTADTRPELSTMLGRAGSLLTRRTRRTAKEDQPLIALDSHSQPVVQGEMANSRIDEEAEAEEETPLQGNAGKDETYIVVDSHISRASIPPFGSTAQRKKESARRTRPSNRQQASRSDKNEMEIEQQSLAEPPITKSRAQRAESQSTTTQPIQPQTQTKPRLTRLTRARQTSTIGGNDPNNDDLPVTQIPTKPNQRDRNPPAPVANMLRSKPSKSQLTNKDAAKVLSQTKTKATPPPATPFVEDDGSDADNTFEANKPSDIEDVEGVGDRPSRQHTTSIPSHERTRQVARQSADTSEVSAASDVEDAEGSKAERSGQSVTPAPTQARKGQTSRRPIEDSEAMRVEIESNLLRLDAHEYSGIGNLWNAIVDNRCALLTERQRSIEVRSNNQRQEFAYPLTDRGAAALRALGTIAKDGNVAVNSNIEKCLVRLAQPSKRELDRFDLYHLIIPRIIRRISDFLDFDDEEAKPKLERLRECFVLLENITEKAIEMKKDFTTTTLSSAEHLIESGSGLQKIAAASKRICNILLLPSQKERQAQIEAERLRRQQRWVKQQEHLQQKAHDSARKHREQEETRVLITQKIYRLQQKAQQELARRKEDEYYAKINADKHPEWTVEQDATLIQRLSTFAALPIPARYSRCADCEDLHTILDQEIRIRAIKLKASMQQRFMDRGEDIPYWVMSIR